MSKLSRHDPTADDSHAPREVAHRMERLVGVDAGKIDTRDIIGDRRP